MTTQLQEIDNPTGNLTVPTVHSEASLMMNPEVFEHMQRVCKVYAESDMVPKQFHKNIANCMTAFELSHRMQISVFQLMQNMYVIQGKPGLEAKMVISLVNMRGPFRGPVQFSEEKDASGKVVACTAYATHKATGERCETRIDWETVQSEGWDKKPGSKWKTMRSQMFRYRSATWLARTYCPEVLMGMQTSDELKDTYNGTRYIENESEPSVVTQIVSVDSEDRDESQPTNDVIDHDPVETQDELPEERPETTWEMLSSRLRNKCGCSEIAADEKIKMHAEKFFDCDPNDLDDSAIKSIVAIIDEGDLTVKTK